MSLDNSFMTRLKEKHGVNEEEEALDFDTALKGLVSVGVRFLLMHRLKIPEDLQKEILLAIPEPENDLKESLSVVFQQINYLVKAEDKEKKNAAKIYKVKIDDLRLEVELLLEASSLHQYL